MMDGCRRSCIVTLTLLLTAWVCTAVALAGSLEDGRAAYKQKDYQTALKLWQPLADQGNAEAQSNICTMYFYGEGVKRDYAEARRWCLEAAYQDNVAAQYKLGRIYVIGGQGVTQDYAEAMKWYRKAAYQGDAEARFNIGWMYKDGLGVKQDYVQTYLWFSLAVAAGEKSAVKELDLIAAEMTSEQIAEGERLAAEWKPSAPPAPAAAP